MDLSPRDFEKLVARALDELPEAFRERLENVAVTIEEEPTEAQLAAHGVPEGETLFGLYEGIPKTARGAGYTFVLPDKITIFRKPILESARTIEEAVEEVRRTVFHELAHHFGISDERLDDLGKW